MNIYCFSTLSFAKLQFKSVINKAFHKHGVASFTDAWIETCKLSINCEIFRMSHLLQMRGLKLIGFRLLVALRKSHLLQMRGLKHFSLNGEHHRHKSHLLQMRGLKQGAAYAKMLAETSHLLQMRGLKLSASTRNSGGTSSHLLQMRGLKPEKPSLNLRACLVASFTDAWIETVRTWERRMKNEVASFTDAWIETVNAF